MYASLLFNKLEPASGYREGLGGTGPPPHYVPVVHLCNIIQFQYLRNKPGNDGWLAGIILTKTL